jgi:hypothetical protein
VKKYEQILSSLIVGGIVVILVADVLRQIIGYVVVAAILAVIYRLLLGDRLGRIVRRSDYVLS